MVENILIALQVIVAIVFIVLMAAQTERAQQSGVMGLGGQGGRMGGEIDMPVGAERVLKPITKLMVIAFLTLSVLSALESNTEGGLTWVHGVIALIVFGVVVALGDRIWNGFLRLFGAATS